MWIETPNTECKVLELLKKNISSNNKKYNIIIAYNTSGTCKNNPNIPNSTEKFNNLCGFCNYLKCVTGKMSIIERFLNSNNYLYTKKSYNYNDGLSCRESGELTYYIITL